MMNTTEAIISLSNIKNFEVKPGLILEPGCALRITPENNIYYYRSSVTPEKLYICYDVDESHDKTIDCLANHFKQIKGNKTLQPFSSKKYY